MKVCLSFGYHFDPSERAAPGCVPGPRQPSGGPRFVALLGVVHCNRTIWIASADLARSRFSTLTEQAQGCLGSLTDPDCHKSERNNRSLPVLCEASHRRNMACCVYGAPPCREAPGGCKAPDRTSIQTPLDRSTTQASTEMTPQAASVRASRGLSRSLARPSVNARATGCGLNQIFVATAPMGVF